MNDMNDKEKIENALDVIEKMIEMEEDHEDNVPSAGKKLRALESIKKILVPEFDLK